MKSPHDWVQKWIDEQNNDDYSMFDMVQAIQKDATASTRDAFMSIITEVLPPVWAYVSSALESLGDSDKVRATLAQAAERAEQLARLGAEPCPHGVRSAADCQDCQHGNDDGWIMHSQRQPAEGAPVYLHDSMRDDKPAVWLADTGHYISGGNTSYGQAIIPGAGTRWRPRAERRDIDDAIARVNPYMPAGYTPPVGSGVGFRLAPAERAWHGPWFNVAERVPELAWQPVYVIDPGSGAERCTFYDVIANVYLTGLAPGPGRYLAGVQHWRPIDRGTRVMAHLDDGGQVLAVWSAAEGWQSHNGKPLGNKVAWWEPAIIATPVPGVYTPSQGKPANPAEVADRRLFAAARAVLAMLESWDYTGAEVAELRAALEISDYTGESNG